MRSLRQGTRSHAIRRARTCYDHLAGRLGTALMSALLRQGALTGDDASFRPDLDRLSAPGHGVDYRLTETGVGLLGDLGLDIDALRCARRPLIRYCVDWSEQRHDLAGGLGAALAQRLLELAWIERAHDSRAIILTEAGASGLRATLGLDVESRAGVTG